VGTGARRAADRRPGRGGGVQRGFVQRALAKGFTEARKQHGESELLDALVSERPHAKRYGSREALEEQGIQRLRDAVMLLEQKATPAEVDNYRKFTLTLAEHVAAAHKEAGAEVSNEEREALDKISAAVSSQS
jgi:hypothetical protein